MLLKGLKLETAARFGFFMRNFRAGF